MPGARRSDALNITETSVVDRLTGLLRRCPCMPTFMYRCPTTGYRVQGFLAEDVVGRRYFRADQMRSVPADPPCESGHRRSRRRGQRIAAAAASTALGRARTPHTKTILRAAQRHQQNISYPTVLPRFSADDAARAPPRSRDRRAPAQLAAALETNFRSRSSLSSVGSSRFDALYGVILWTMRPPKGISQLPSGLLSNPGNP